MTWGYLSFNSTALRDANHLSLFLIFLPYIFLSSNAPTIRQRHSKLLGSCHVSM